MKSYVDEDGRWRHKFGASWLKTADLCLERARREHTGEMDNVESDAASVGTAVHLAAEVCLSSGGLTLADTLDLAHDEFSRLMALDGTNGDPNAAHAEGVFKWIKYNEAQARELVTKFTALWHEEVLPTLNVNAATEWNFTVPLLATDERVIELTGTSDYVDGCDMKDWKTSGGGPYKKWEYERWAIQPSVYTYAANLLRIGSRCTTFEYVVMHAKGVQRFHVERDERHWEWMAQKCIDAALLIEREMPSWPKNDNHALCSEKWCPAFMTCKGATGITF